MGREINGILEGAQHDTTSRLEYAPINFPFHENASVLLINQARLLRYGFLGKLWIPSSFHKSQIPSKNTKGLEMHDHTITDHPDWINWVFEMPRSIFTKKGVLYVNECHFKKGFEYYLDCIPTILEDGCNFYSGVLDSESLAGLARRAF